MGPSAIAMWSSALWVPLPSSSTSSFTSSPFLPLTSLLISTSLTMGSLATAPGMTGTSSGVVTTPQGR